MKKRNICGSVIAWFALLTLSGCVLESERVAESGSPAQAEVSSSVAVTVTRAVGHMSIDGITDIYVEKVPGEAQPKITVIGMSAIAVLDDNLNVRKRFSYHNSRVESVRKLIPIGDDEAPIIVSAGYPFMSARRPFVVEAHDLAGNHLWARQLSFRADFLDAFRGQDGQFYICLVETGRKECQMAIIDLSGNDVFRGPLPRVNSDETVAVFDIGDGDRLWIGSNNKMISINEHGELTSQLLEFYGTWINGVDSYRLLGETNERAILFSYSKVVDLIGRVHKQKYVAFIGETMDDMRREEVADEEIALGRRNGTKLDKDGAYWIQYYSISNRSNDVSGARSGSMWISAADGTFAARHDFTPTRLMEGGHDVGAMAVVERNADHAIVVAGKGNMFWIARIDFPLPASVSVTQPSN